MQVKVGDWVKFQYSRDHGIGIEEVVAVRNKRVAFAGGTGAFFRQILEVRPAGGRP